MAEEQSAALAGKFIFTLFQSLVQVIQKNSIISAAEGGEGETQVLDIDPAQLAALLAQSADGTAQLIDEHGNTITVSSLPSFGLRPDHLASLFFSSPQSNWPKPASICKTWKAPKLFSYPKANSTFKEKMVRFTSSPTTKPWQPKDTSIRTLLLVASQHPALVNRWILPSKGPFCRFSLLTIPEPCPYFQCYIAFVQDPVGTSLSA